MLQGNSNREFLVTFQAVPNKREMYYYRQHQTVIIKLEIKWETAVKNLPTIVSIRCTETTFFFGYIMHPQRENMIQFLRLM